MNIFVAIVLLAWSTTPGQNQNAVNQALGSCGAANVQFDVKTESSHRPDTPTDPDKAVVYVIESQRAGCFMCDTTVKVGIDGNWAGATRGNSYAFFTVDPGDHHLCTAMQAGASRTDHTALAVLTAEAGRVYYFRARLTDRNNSGKGSVEWALDLDPINSDEGQLLVASYPYSSSRPRKTSPPPITGAKHQ